MLEYFISSLHEGSNVIAQPVLVFTANSKIVRTNTYITYCVGSTDLYFYTGSLSGSLDVLAICCVLATLLCYWYVTLFLLHIMVYETLK